MSATGFPVEQKALAYTATNIALSAGQAAGTDILIPANADRRALMFRAAANFELALSASASAGQRIFAKARDGMIGPECPMGALYLVPGSGLVAGNVLTVWEA